MYDYNHVLAVITDSSAFKHSCYRNAEDIDWDTLDLSLLPKADFSEINAKVDHLEKWIPELITATYKSRMDVSKKDYVKSRFDYVLGTIGSIRNPQIGKDKDVELYCYEKLNSVLNCLEDIRSNLPTAHRNSFRCLVSDFDQALRRISRTEGDRSFTLHLLKDRLLEYAEKVSVEREADKIKEQGYTMKSIEDSPNDYYLAAVRRDVYEKYGRGATDLVNALNDRKRFNNAFPTMGWVFDKEVEGVISFAKDIGLTEFAFTGFSTAALSNLNIITKMGLHFRIEEVKIQSHMGEEEKPMAIISL